MNFDLQKCFISLMDFFSILVPGAMLTILLMGEVGSVVLRIAMPRSRAREPWPPSRRKAEGSDSGKGKGSGVFIWVSVIDCADVRAASQTCLAFARMVESGKFWGYFFREMKLPDEWEIYVGIRCVGTNPP